MDVRSHRSTGEITVSLFNKTVTHPLLREQQVREKSRNDKYNEKRN
jgi:hypothetical protein